MKRGCLASASVLCALGVSGITVPAVANEAGPDQTQVVRPMTTLSVGKPLIVGNWEEDACGVDTAWRSGVGMRIPLSLAVSRPSKVTLALTAFPPVSTTSPKDWVPGNDRVLNVFFAGNHPMDPLGPPVGDKKGRAFGGRDAVPPIGAASKVKLFTATLAKGRYMVETGTIRPFGGGAPLYGFCAGLWSVSLVKMTPLKPTTPTKIKAAKFGAKRWVVDRGIGVQLRPTLFPTGIEKVNLTWKSSNPKVVKVSKKGVATGVNHGIATVKVTATKGKSRATASVKIVVP